MWISTIIHILQMKKLRLWELQSVPHISEWARGKGNIQTQAHGLLEHFIFSTVQHYASFIRSIAAGPIASKDSYSSKDELNGAKMTCSL